MANQAVFPIHLAFSFLCRACLRQSPLWCSGSTDDPPAPGEFWVCPGCGQAYRYTLSTESDGNGYLAIRFASAAEIDALEPVCQAAVRQAQERASARARARAS